MYNRQDGVITDKNGLIYMRARYYSPEPRRFVNADIVAGSLGNPVKKAIKKAAKYIGKSAGLSMVEELAYNGVFKFAEWYTKTAISKTFGR